MEGARVRVVFEEHKMLRRWQKSEGLKRCWLLLNNNDLKTISDLVLYLLRLFDLPDACPNGLILSMNGFVFPHFESTSILKDNDIICVRRKRNISSNAIKGYKYSSDEEDEASKEQLLNSDLKLITNEEFEKETSGGHEQCECNGRVSEETSTDVKLSDKKSKLRKRKAAKTLKCVKKRYHVRKDDGTDTFNAPELTNGTCCDTLNVKKIIESKEATDEVRADTLDTPSPNKVEPLQQNGVQTDHHVHTGETQTAKKISRSARRKKAKRKLMRELVKGKEKTPVQVGRGTKRCTQEPGYGPNKQIETGQPNEANGNLIKFQSFEEQDDEMDDVVFPVVVRPGHIRFQPAGKAGLMQLENNEVNSQEDGFRWNGITDKRKGQKWGRQKWSSSSNDYYHSEPENEYYHHSIGKQASFENLTPSVDSHSPLDFQNLGPFLCSPKKGDVIAYRLLELTSMWTPELSSFRVGEVSSFQEESYIVLLLPVPEYPVHLRECHEEDADDPPLSLYKEDGSLEIDFRSLVDVRAVSTKGGVEGQKMDGWGGRHSGVHPEMDGWDEIDRALSKKKSELCVVGVGGGGKAGRVFCRPRGGLACTIDLLRSRHQL